MTGNLVIRALLSVTVLGAVLAGCSDTAGTPSPETTGTTAAPTGDAGTSTTTSAPTGDSLANFDACEALRGVASELGLTRIEEAKAGGCEARHAERTAVRVIPFPELGVEDFVPGPNTQLSDFPMSGHKAKRATAPTTDSSCAIVIEITSSSRVDVAASSPSTQEQACEAATKVATAIEPNLP